MSIYSINNQIKVFRERKNISQEELSFGICSVSTLSKIETGKQTPNKTTTDALLERLGMRSCNYDFNMTNSERNIYELKQSISNDIVNHNFNYQEKLDSLISLIDSNDVINTQFYNYTSITLQRFTQQDCSVKYSEKYAEVLRLTIPDFDIQKNLYFKLLTHIEANLLNNIATSLFEENDLLSSIKVFLFLETFYRDIDFDVVERDNQYPSIVSNLTNCLLRTKQYKEVIKLCDKGIDICIKYGKLTQFPFLLYNKGYALCFLDQIESGIKIIKQSTTILEAMNNEELAAWMTLDINEKFNISIPINYELNEERRKLFLVDE